MLPKLDLDAARQVCEVVSGGPLSPGSSMVEVRARGVQAVLVVRLNTNEVERRQREGADAVLDMAVLDGLMQLPVGSPVPSMTLTSKERRLLRGCPADALEQTDGQLVRRLVRPLEVDLAVVRVSRLTAGGLSRAGRFGPYTQSVVWLDGPAEGAELVVMEAGMYGLGVVHAPADEAPFVCVAPRPASRFVPTSAGWLFAEQVYAELQDAEGFNRVLLPTS
ncbi:hypothetical protein ACIPSE_12250 [Streptomyces sp. NPDC090106]|uniref:hypothetical protein n=1 Tax=Streptomyces sp. NPDC090106 TaxID=3365946 RepID=UPI003818FA20